MVMNTTRIELDPIAAIGHMLSVTVTMSETALAQRLSLLHAGFADGHPMCLALDDIALLWNDQTVSLKKTLKALDG